MATQAINIEINKPREKFMWVSLTVVLGFVFMVFFEPFNLFANSSATVFDVVFELAIASLIAFIILLLTQFVARELFGLKSFTRLGLIAWYLLESLLVGIVWSLADEVDHSASHNFWEQIPINFFAFVSIFAIPYFGFVFWFNSKKLKQQLVEAAETRKVETVRLENENSKTVLIVDTKDILYLNSADNYVEVNLLKDGNSVETKVLRNNLKKLEPIFFHTDVIRCHRSYMVNTLKVSKAEKTATGMQLQLQNLSQFVPVSKTYLSEVEKAIQG